MSFLLFVALLLGVTVIPVMIGARMVGAGNTGFGSALLAVIALTLISMGVDKFFGNQLLGYLVSAVAGGYILAGILRTSFWRGIAVSIITVVIQVIVFVVFAGALMGGAVVKS